MKLDVDMARTREMYGSEHVAGVLLGDSNLNLAEAEEAAQQPHTGVPLGHNVWHAKAATGQHGGDVMFIKGGIQWSSICQWASRMQIAV